MGPKKLFAQFKGNRLGGEIGGPGNIGGGKISGGDDFVGNFRLSGRWRKFPLAKFSVVDRAVKIPMAMHTVGPQVLGKCLEQQILSGVVN